MCLLSGGLDSATVLAIAKHDGRDCIALSFAYGQRHEIELAAARNVAKAMDVVEHVLYPIDLRVFGASALNLAHPEYAAYPSPHPPPQGGREPCQCAYITRDHSLPITSPRKP